MRAAAIDTLNQLHNKFKITSLRKLNEESSDQEIKTMYRKIALCCHPDKIKGYDEDFRNLDQAYKQLTLDESTDKSEIPSWMDVNPLSAELKSAEGAMATPDQHKPTIADFFLSLNRQLAGLKKASCHREVGFCFDHLEIFESISIEDQIENSIYLEESIDAIQKISFLLSNYIDTSKETHWQITETARKLDLGLMLNRQFKRLNPETSILQVKDALTFSLAKVLLNHLVYLRHPQRNFKSTENSYHLDLLDDVSDMIRNYYDALYEQVDQHYLQKLAYGNGSIFMKLYEPREHLAKLDRVIKQGNADLDVVKNTLLDLYATISGQKEYILFHSRYPDNLTTFDVYSQRLYHNLGARGMHRSEVIKNMIHYNLLVTSLKENFSDNQAINELRIFTNVGYESIDELNKETTSIVRQFQESEIPEHHVQVTHEKFLQQQKGNWVILAGTAIAPPLDYSFLERYPSESKGTSESQALSVTSQSDKYGYSVHQGADVVEIDGVSQPIEIISKAINLAPDLKSSLTLLQDELNKAYKKELEKSNPSKILLQRYVDISNNSEQLVHKLNDKTLTMEGKINAIHVFVTNSKSQTSIAKNVAKAILIVAITAAAVLTTALVVAGILALAGTAVGPAGTLTGGVLGFLKGALIGWSATKIAAASAVGTVTCVFSSYKLFTPQNIDAHVDKVANAAHAHV